MEHRAEKHHEQKAHAGEKHHQWKAHVHKHTVKSEEDKACCATWTAKTVDSPSYCWVKGTCIKWGAKATARDYSTVEEKFCAGKGMCS